MTGEIPATVAAVGLAHVLGASWDEALAIGGAIIFLLVFATARSA